ncbi:MAG: hypothetical protein ACE5IL_04070 [Myxococcota bacterium]
MSDLESRDRRVVEREMRDRKITAEQVREAMERLPDLATNVRTLDPEEIESFRQALAPEAELRGERIERALQRAVAPPPPPPRPVQEFEPEDL